jgi:hypothetical protein
MTLCDCRFTHHCGVCCCSTSRIHTGSWAADCMYLPPFLLSGSMFVRDKSNTSCYPDAAVYPEALRWPHGCAIHRDRFG